jgi:hypothetical protein
LNGTKGIQSGVKRREREAHHTQICIYKMQLLSIFGASLHLQLFVHKPVYDLLLNSAGNMLYLFVYMVRDFMEIFLLRLG